MRYNWIQIDLLGDRWIAYGCEHFGKNEELYESKDRDEVILRASRYGLPVLCDSRAVGVLDRLLRAGRGSYVDK